jgi:hypothetical protein
MVGDMENLKVKANNKSESKEAQDLFSDLGFTNSGALRYGEGHVYVFADTNINRFYNATNQNVKEITLQKLKDLVVLKRNSIDDATHYYDDSKYYLTDSEFYQYSENKWVNIDEYVDGMAFKKMDKEVDVKTKEYLDVNYELRSVKQTSGDNHVPSGWIEVPEGAEILYFEKLYESANHFFKTVNGKSYYKYLEKDSEWIEYGIEGLDEFKDTIDNFRVVWQRNKTTPNTSTQEKLKFIEKWLNGEKIQYILGIESEKTQSDNSKVDESKWHNFTEGAMQYIKRSDIKFREAPKYVTINGIEFKSVKSLIKHVKNNFDLEDGE